MANTLQKTATDITEKNLPDDVKNNWQLLVGLGIALICLGVISTVVANVTTLISIVSFGIFLLLSGIIQTYQAVKFWRQHHRTKFLLQFGNGILYMLAGLILLFYPAHGAISLTFILAVFYIAIGIYRGAFALSDRTSGRNWGLFSSLITILLGIFILMQWPSNSLWVIGIFVGIDMMFIGWAFIMRALAKPQ